MLLRVRYRWAAHINWDNVHIMLYLISETKENQVGLDTYRFILLQFIKQRSMGVGVLISC